MHIIYIHIYIHILSNPFPQRECDTRLIFRWIFRGLNSDFSFS